MKIYVVEGSTGEYSDHRDWPVLAYADKTKAQDKVLRCEERARLAAVVLDSDAYWDDPTKAIAPFQDEDPAMQIAYTGTRYYVLEVEYEA